MQPTVERNLALATWHDDAAVPPEVAPAPVIATKLQPPRLPPSLVSRPQRSAVLSAGVRVAAVVAPAGYGKTVLVREWLDGVSDRAVAWYSLDALDANPLCFWRHLVAALDGAAGIGPEPERVLDERGVGTPFLHALIHALADVDRDVVLVLDDLHLLRDRTSLDHLALLVDRAGDAFQFVFTARVAPLLPLAKWRLQQRLVEVTVDDLRFDDSQTTALLQALRCAPVGEQGLATLVDRSEGWVAGLQLAALANPSDVARAVVDLPSDGALVADYLVSEVLDALPPEQRQLALAVSVLDEFDADLAAALSGRPDAAGVIRALEDGNVFIVRSGDQRADFRFHHLFRTLLREQLRRDDEPEWRRLHTEAARLLAADGHTDAAFGHLMEIGDLDGAFDLVIRPALKWSDLGLCREFRRWMEQLPDDLELDDPDLMLDLAFANFTAGRLEMAEAWIDRAEPLCPPGDRRAPMRRLAVAVARGDREQAAAAVDAGRRATVQSEASPFEHRFEVVVARTAMLQGDLDAADAALARAEGGEADELAIRVTVPAMRARLHVARGEVLAAEHSAAVSLDAARRFGLRTNPAIFEAVFAGTAAVLGQGRTDDAAVWLDDLLDVVDAVDYPYSRAHAAALTVELHAQQHGWAATAAAIDDLCARCGHSSPSPLDHLLVPLRVRALAASGRLDEAAAAADAVEGAAARAIAAAEVAVARRHYADVPELLIAADAGTPRDRVVASVLRAVATAGPEAERAFTAAVELAMPLGLRSPFLDRAAELAPAARGLSVEQREFLPHLGRATGPAPTRLPSLVEQLTPRERELLALLPTHLSNAAMGERLYLSVNTVKTNLKAVYRKLGASSRADAVDIARGLGLLPEQP
ncbi:MAG: hypothetical protein RL238_2417 [Actinomycetota bacterium]|jgi:LuxR family maltose regulon positive regulatory protein